MTRLTVPLSLLLTGLMASTLGCRGSMGAPDSPAIDPSEEEALVGLGGNYREEEEDDEGALDEEYGALAELPSKGKVKKSCRGKGKRRKCKMKDTKPKVSAGSGVRRLMKGFRWGMEPKTVLDRLTARIDADYATRMAGTTEPTEQDEHRDWRRTQVQELAKNHVAFDSAARHRWGVSIIQYEYADDENEEMIYHQENPTLKKFYFFRDGELWKIVYAYGEDAFPGQSYTQVVEDKFKKWFGISPEEKVQKDPNSKAPVLAYLQWEAFDGERVRAFDMTKVHGSHLLVVVNGRSEDRIGARLPTVKQEEQLNEEVGDVLGGTDVCYDADGELIEDAAKCKTLGY